MQFRATRGNAVLSLVLCAFLWSSAGILIKIVQWDAFALAGTRSLIGFFTILIFVPKPRFAFSADQVLAAVFYSATMILFVLANKMTTSANAVLLQYTEPVFIVLFGIFLLRDEKTSLFDWLIIAGVLFGMVLFFLDDLTVGANAGNFLAVLSGITFALTAIFMRRQKNGRPVESFMLAHILTFIVSIPFIIRAGMPDRTGFAGLALLGVFQVGLPSLLYGRGVTGVSAVSVALITMLEPVLNPLWVALFYREYPSVRALAGGFIIVCCVTLRTVFKVRKI